MCVGGGGGSGDITFGFKGWGSNELTFSLEVGGSGKIRVMNESRS